MAVAAQAGPQRAGVGEQQVRVEVPPRELAAQGPRPLPGERQQPLLDRAGRERAPAQVRRELRRAARHHAAPRAVVRRDLGQRALQRGVRRALARARDGLRGPVGEPGELAGLERRGGRRDALRCRQHGPALLPLPGPGEGREDREGLAVGRAHAGGVGDVGPRARARRDPGGPQRLGHLAVAPARERRDVARPGHDLRTRLARELGQHRARVPAAHQQLAPPGTQRLAQLGQAGQQERRPVLRHVAAAALEQPRVEDEDARHATRRRGVQRGVVVHPQVTPEPDERGLLGHPDTVGRSVRQRPGRPVR